MTRDLPTRLSRRALLVGAWAWWTSERTARARQRQLTLAFFPGVPGARDEQSNRGMRLGLDEAKRLAELLGGTIQVVEPAARTEAAAWIGLSHALPMTPSHIPSIAVDDGGASEAPQFRVMATLPRRLARIGPWLKTQQVARWAVCGSAAAARADATGTLRKIAGLEVVQDVGRADAVLVLDAESGALAHPDAAAWIVGDSRNVAAFRTHRSISAAEWHHALKRYGALELNERYRRAYDEPMSAAAWAGWFAVKCAAEAAFRSSPQGIAESLRTLHVDGHKGVALRFLADRTLDQPLYLVGRARPGGEIELLDQGEGS